jgi:nicotinamide mononucleotide adenylyltransferase
MKKIGLFIGNFNPFHKGHQSVCEYMIENNVLDEINIIPLSMISHKLNNTKEDLLLNYCLEMIHNQLCSSKFFGCDPEKMSKIVVGTNNSSLGQIILKLHENKMYLVIGSDVFLDSVKSNKNPLKILLSERELTDNTKEIDMNDYINKNIDEYVIIQRGIEDKQIFDSVKNSEIFGKKFSIYNDVPDQSITSLLIRNGEYKFISTSNIKYIQSNHLYEIERIHALGYDYDEIELLDDKTETSTYRIILKDKTAICVRIGYTVNMMSVSEILKEFGKISSKYIHNNILVIEKLSGYLLMDLLKDKTDIFLTFEQFEDIGVAIGRFMKDFHMSKTFNADARETKMYDEICLRCEKSEFFKDFKKNPGRLSLVHDDINPYNIFVDFPTKPITDTDKMRRGINNYLADTKTSGIKINLINFDSLVASIKTGGFAAYEYYRFVRSILLSSRKAMNSSHLVKGFIMGYEAINDISPKHTTNICREYWSY